MGECALRPGYTEMMAASLLSATDSAGWEKFMREVLDMPLSLLPAVKHVVKMGVWKRSKDPLNHVKRATENWAMRDDFKPGLGGPKGQRD